jgi:CubicO group peptidase (beta-lactamase class C family)
VPGLLPRTVPEAVGLPSAAVSALVDRLESSGCLPRSLVIVRHGAVAAEAWWAPNRPDMPQMLFSLTKSFTSIGVGIAIDEGRFALDDPVAPYFASRFAGGNAPEPPLTVRNLLMMSGGHSDQQVDEGMAALGVGKVVAYLSLPFEFEPGSRMEYSSAATHVLGELIQETSGEQLVDYLRRRLFDPLGFGPVSWDEFPPGTNPGGYGLAVRTDEIAAFGQMLLQRGEWQGRRIVSAEWIEQASARQIDTPASDDADMRLGYGFQFWRSRHGFRADGAFGQHCIVVPEQDLVVAITSGVDTRQRVLDVIWEELLAELRPEPLLEDSVAHEALAAKLARLGYQPRAGDPSSPIELTLDGRTFGCEPNRFGFGSLRFRFGDEGGRLSVVQTDGQASGLDFGRGAWRAGASGLLADWQGWPISASAAWPSEERLEIDVISPATPYRYLLAFDFNGPGLTLSIGVNLSFFDQHMGTIRATHVD